MNITVIGTGYVGLVTGAGLADFGNDVICVDIDAAKIEALREGKIPIYEPGLDAIVAKNTAEGRLRFSTDLAESIRAARAIFIAVGTPPKSDGSADLRYVEQVARTIAKYMDGPKLIITKSTVPIGTGRMIESILDESEHKFPASIVSNPEFLREGSAIEDFMHPDRVVIGTSDEESIALMKEIYAPLHSLSVPFVVTNVESAELIKYAANGFLATKISFINEIAVLCERLGGDVQDVARGIGLDSRIGPKFLQAGPGFGGSCFPKDTSAIADIARQHGYSFKIGGASVRAYDPEAMENAKKMFMDVVFCHDAYETAEGCDALVIATEWNEFRALNLTRLKSSMKSPVVIDLRNVYDPVRMEKEGFEYSCLGRRKVVKPAPLHTKAGS